MDKTEYRSVCILGRQPALGVAELEALYGADNLRPIEGAALLKTEAVDINFKRLGGTLKVARILATWPSVKWTDLFKRLYEAMPDHIEYMPEGTFNFGLSTYGLKIDVQEQNRDMLKLKKLIKASHPVRVVPNKTNELNSAQVLHNKLTHRGGWELIFIRDGEQTILAQTLFVQDIEAYAARDQARPKRDARVGMLPPKLAQTIINLADPDEGATVLDPFCGTGVLLQEALLMGYPTLGTDLEKKMIDFAEENIGWLQDNSERQLPTARFEVGDATSHQWKDFQSLATETYLGRSFTNSPPPDVLKQNISDVNLIIKKFLKNLHSQIPSGFRMCLALPAWKTNNTVSRLPLLDQLTDMGYNRLALKHVSFDELIYAREGQIVGRELVILERL